MIEYYGERDDPSISVVIPTLPSNDHTKIVKNLRENQNISKFEILVVNDSEYNLSEARNVGVRSASAEVVAMTDDDTNPPPEWLTAAVDTFREHEELGLLEGPVSGGINYDGVGGGYVGCNLAVRQSALIEIGGFDTELSGWREDTEFGWRMEDNEDWETAYESKFWMRHPPAPRSPFDAEHEAILRSRFPERYQKQMNKTIFSRAWRVGQRIGLVPILNKIRTVR